MMGLTKQNHSKYLIVICFYARLKAFLHNQTHLGTRSNPGLFMLIHVEVIRNFVEIAITVVVHKFRIKDFFGDEQLRYYLTLLRRTLLPHCFWQLFTLYLLATACFKERPICDCK